MSIIPPEKPVGRPKPIQQLIEEMIKTTEAMIREVEPQAKNARFGDLNFLIPYTLFFGKPLARRLEEAKNLISFIKDAGAPPETMSGFIKELMESIKPQTTAGGQIIKAVTVVSDSFVEALGELIKGASYLRTRPIMDVYAGRIFEILIQFVELTGYIGSRRVIQASPNQVYSSLISILETLNIIYPFSLSST